MGNSWKFIESSWCRPPAEVQTLLAVPEFEHPGNERRSLKNGHARHLQWHHWWKIIRSICRRFTELVSVTWGFNGFQSSSNFGLLRFWLFQLLRVWSILAVVHWLRYGGKTKTSQNYLCPGLKNGHAWHPKMAHGSIKFRYFHRLHRPAPCLNCLKYS